MLSQHMSITWVREVTNLVRRHVENETDHADRRNEQNRKIREKREKPKAETRTRQLIYGEVVI